MDFGEILDEWEKTKGGRGPSSGTPAKKPKSEAFEDWIARNGVQDKDADLAAVEDREGESRRLSSLRPQDVLDLHGMTAGEAAAALGSFIDSASRRGLEKILVIHGKGLHSEGAPVLKKTARRTIEAHPLAGRFGEAEKADGGSGALWVMIRRGR